MTCEYPAPPCCRCECCKDLPQYIQLTFHNVNNWEGEGECTECGWFEGRSFLLQQVEEAECPLWRYQEATGPCYEEGRGVTLEFTFVHPPAEIPGDMDTCEIQLSVDDSSGEGWYFLAYFSELPKDCYNLGTISNQDDAEEDINKCNFSSTRIDIRGLDSPE